MLLRCSRSRIARRSISAVPLNVYYPESRSDDPLRSGEVRLAQSRLMTR